MISGERKIEAATICICEMLCIIKIFIEVIGQIAGKSTGETIG